MLDCFETGTELGIDCWPGYGSGFAELMTAPREPHIDVEAHGAITQLTDCRLQQRHRVVPQCIPENLVEYDAVFPKHALSVLRHLEAKPGGDNGAARPGFVFVVFPKKLECTSRNSRSLFFQAARCFAADGKAHAFHPVPHGTAKCDFTTSCTDGLSL